MNKQIIIDDLDTRCPYHCNEKIGQCNNPSQETPHTYCIDNKDCIYKLYARKEQENKDLRKDIKDIANLLDLDTGEEYNFGNIELEIKQLKAKEQECEQQKAELELFKKSNQTTIDQLKAENEELKEINQELLKYRKHSTTCQECYEDGLEDGKTSNKELRKLRKTLAEIKPILEFYANSKMGEEQSDRTYKIMCSGGYIMAYDPKPAREALRKINEVEKEEK